MYPNAHPRINIFQLNPRTFMLRFNPSILPSTTQSGGIILAAVMNGKWIGNKDEFLFLGFFEDTEVKDAGGRIMGSIVATTRGILYLGGNPLERVPHRWYHLCFSVDYGTGNVAHRWEQEKVDC